jgi:hypothetical protein
MSQSQAIAQVSQTNASDPLYRKLQRLFFALSVLLAPLLMAGWFTLCPQYGDPTCPSSVHPDAAIAAFRAANPTLMQIFNWVTLIIPYLYPIGYIGLGLLAMKRSPWLATIGIAFGWLGSIAWGFISDTILLINSAIQVGQDTAFVALMKAHYADPLILFVAIGWVLGHWGGYVLLGIALWRSRAIPRWAAILIIISGPVMGPIAYGVNIGMAQVLGFILVFVGSIPAALVILNARSNSIG